MRSTTEFVERMVTRQRSSIVAGSKSSQHRVSRRRSGARSAVSEQEARMNPYWICQIVGWSLHGVAVAAIPTLYGGLRWPVVVRAVVGAILGLVFTHQLRRHLLRKGWLRLPLRRLVPRIVGATLGIAAAMVLGVTPFLLLIIPPPSRVGAFAAIFAGHTTIVLGWVMIYLGVHYLRSVRTAEAEKLRLELAMRDTELQALRAQLNPHFLFNSLNSLRGLITEDPTRAQEAITDLAALLRYTLQLSRARTTTLELELEATRHYLELEALRFEARLAYGIDVEPRALQHQVPPMLVQTLVENAIKHGIAQLPEGGVVRIDARKPADDLHIRVTNTGTFTHSRNARGIGLANSLERLRLIYGDRVRLDLVASGPNEVTCNAVVPAPIGEPAARSSRSWVDS
jgi:Histidine kinase